MKILKLKTSFTPKKIMFTLPPLIVAKPQNQALFYYDIISVYYTAMSQDIFYIVHYNMSDYKFYLVPISGASFPTLPLSYLNDTEDWEYYGPADEIDPPITIAWPHDTFLDNLDHYLNHHYVSHAS